MPLRQCTFNGCNVAVEVPHNYRDSPRCELHQRTLPTPKRRYEHHYHNGKNIYKTTQWRNLRAQYVAFQPLCEHCLAFDIIKPGKIVDHIIELEDGGQPFEKSNLQHLCHSCHNTKTGREKKKRTRIKQNKGFGSLSDF